MKNINTYNNFLNEKKIIPYDLDYIFFVNMFKKLNYNIIEFIGSGMFGYCFLTDKNTVLKYTTDISNACAALILLNIKNEYLVDYYDVFNIIYKLKEYTIIEMEYVEKYDEKKMRNVYNIFKSGYYYTNNIFYKLHYNSYVRDLYKIKEEAITKNVEIDFQNTGNFGIKNNHLCAIDLSGGGLFTKFDLYKQNIRNINID